MVFLVRSDAAGELVGLFRLVERPSLGPGTGLLSESPERDLPVIDLGIGCNTGTNR